MAGLQLTPVLGGGMYVDVQIGASAENSVAFAFILLILVVFVGSEVTGWHVPYSKFAKEDQVNKLPLNVLQKLFAAQMGSRLGFFILYFSPIIAYIVIWSIYAGQNQSAFGQVAFSKTYSSLLFAGWLLSFSKRCLEVLFVHIYSGEIPIVSTMLIGVGYSALGLITALYTNQVIGYEAFGSRTIVKDVICIIVFFVGMTINFISHIQLRLARQRAKEMKRYLAPAEIGLLFRVFICPHYIFEAVGFMAWSVFGATVVHYLTGTGMLCYLSLRTRATYQWYIEKGLLNPKRKTASQKVSLLSSNNPNFGVDV
jgi:hypothetical protein